MDRFDRSELERLVSPGEGLSVSVFQPTHRKGNQIQQDPIRLHNLLDVARERLAERGVQNSEMRRILRPADALVGAQTFWQHQAEGLALFLRGGEMYTYRVPLPLEELVVVGRRFHLKPLVPLLTGDGSFFILALSQKDVRLLEATRHSVRELEVEGLPKNIEDALPYEDPEAQLQFRAGPSPTPASINPAPRSTRPGVVFHGHDPKDQAKDTLLRFCRNVAGGLREVLTNRSAPLVLAGVDHLLSIYREVDRYPHVLDEEVEGNSALMRAEELHARAWELVHPVFVQAEEEARQKFANLEGTGRTADSPAQVVPAASEGRVDTLFVARGAHAWGRFDPESGSVEMHHDQREPGDEDLLDRAAIETLRTSGTVYAVPADRVPGRREAAAILRY